MDNIEGLICAYILRMVFSAVVMVYQGNTMSEKSVSVKMNMEGKNIIIAYILWWFLGWAGAHRFYLGRTTTGFTQLILTIIGFTTLIFMIGYLFLFIVGVWWMLDAYFTYIMVEEENEKQGVVTSSFSFSKSGGFHNDLDELEKLHALYEKGVLTKEQYEKKKAEFI